MVVSMLLVVETLRARQESVWRFTDLTFCGPPLRGAKRRSNPVLGSGLLRFARSNDGAVLSLQRHALVLQQPTLALEPAAILYQRTIGPDQAMAGHDDADRVGAVGMTDGAHGVRHVEFGGQRAVAHRGPRRNLWQRGPY